MRLNDKQIKHIKTVAKAVFGEKVIIKLFGSQLDDTAKGSDIDLLVELNQAIITPLSLAAKLATKIMLKNHGRKIDVLVIAPNLTPAEIHLIAQQQGIIL